jgi:hypothetical protein
VQQEHDDAAGGYDKAEGQDSEWDLFGVCRAALRGPGMHFTPAAPARGRARRRRGGHCAPTNVGSKLANVGVVATHHRSGRLAELLTGLHRANGSEWPVARLKFSLG